MVEMRFESHLSNNQCVSVYLCVFYSCAGINESYQMGLFQVLAAILHLGNVEIKDRDSDSSVIPVRIIFKQIMRDSHDFISVIM